MANLTKKTTKKVAKKPVAKKPVAKPTPEPTAKTEAPKEAPKKPAEKSKEKKVDLSKKIESFKSKLVKNVRVANVAPFAKAFFGDDFKKSTVKTGLVTITLTNGDSIEVPAI